MKAMPDTIMTKPSGDAALLPLPAPSPALQQYLAMRRSVSANDLTEPGPDAEQLAMILRLAARVPDHKKLAPWRFILFEGERRQQFGEVLAGIIARKEPDASPDRLDIERRRFSRALVVVAVISAAQARPGVPEWEQVLSAGAVCLNMLHAAASFGFAANWITEWYAYDDDVRAELGCAPHERAAGFVYIGTGRTQPKERDRPDMAAITEAWTPR
jgi:nitroreductase